MPTKKRLSADRMTEAGYKTTDWRVYVPQDATREDILSPEYWTNLVGPGRRVQVFDRISLLNDQASFYLELLVVNIGAGFMKVIVLVDKDIDAALSVPLTEDEPLQVDYKGPHLKHIVVRKSDGVILKEGISKKTDAEQWARDHIRAMAA